MDKISKVLKKLSSLDEKRVKEILLKLQDNNIENFNLKKLKEYSNIYRIRKGKIRIIVKISEKKIIILTIERRSDKIYNF